MIEQDQLYPQYGLAQHKGYGTKAHMAAIAEHGFTPIHRRSYCKSIEML
jgi:ribonuclease HII